MFICLKMKSSLWPLTKNNLELQNLHFSTFRVPQQMVEIREGLEYNLDVSIYAKSDFSDYQMDEIKLGLKDNLDVSLYTKPEYSWKQMNEKRKILLKESTLKQFSFLKIENRYYFYNKTFKFYQNFFETFKHLKKDRVHFYCVLFFNISKEKKL